MCGRYSLTKEPLAVLDELGRDGVPLATEAGSAAAFAPRYNIAPTQPVPVVRVRRPGEPPALVELRWGLVPWWAKDLSIGGRLINARAEKAAESSAFRDGFARRRCLVLADGFYEWRRAGRQKLPHYLRLRSGRAFAFAGLWARWRDPGNRAAEPIESCTILTGAPNELVAPLHDRMPIILPPQSYRPWLDPTLADRAALEAIVLRPFPAAEMESWAVSAYVNHADHEGPECVAPVTATGDG
jgi:putative SOS response-associated peptidase YedK